MYSQLQKIAEWNIFNNNTFNEVSVKTEIRKDIDQRFINDPFHQGLLIRNKSKYLFRYYFVNIKKVHL